jgi:hypothetical protein
MKKTLLSLSIALAGTAIATPFTGNDAQSNAMGNTGVASATPQNAFQFNPGLLADYPDSNDFGLTLPSIKFFIDDSLGFVSSAEELVTGGAWEDFQNVDAAAFNTAVLGGGGEPSMVTVLGNITTEAGSVASNLAAIQADISDNGTIDTPSNVTALETASANLTTETATLDTKVGVANTQSGNIDTVVSGALSSLTELNDAPLQVGLGIDVISVAIPSNTLGMALSISTNSSVGMALNLSSNDLTPVTDLSDDLTAITGRATTLTGSLNTLVAANNALTAHITEQPDTADYAGGAANPQYLQDLSDWGETLETLGDTVASAQTEVDTNTTALTSYSGNYVSNGDITPPTVGELTSEVEVVGANINELGITVARQFEIMGETVAIGVTPKIQSVNIFEKTFGLSTYEDDLEQISSDPLSLLSENSTTKFVGNIDIGAAKTWDFHGRVRAGIALKDIIPWTLESVTGNELLIRPKLRVGAAHETRLTKLAIDLDITNNKPLKYGVPSRFLGLGAEFNAWNWAAIRAGYRNNLSVSDSSVISGGIGFTPFGTGLDISAWVKPQFDDPAALIQDVGAVVQFSVNF